MSTNPVGTPGPIRNSDGAFERAVDVAHNDLMRALARFAPGDEDASALYAFMVRAQDFATRRQFSSLVDWAMQVALRKRWMTGERRP